MPEDPLAGLLAQARGPVSRELQAHLSSSPSEAAVLLGLVERPSGLQVLLTERAAHLSEHAGQVSFPGGRFEAADSGPEDTALREADEEVGLKPSLVSVAGSMRQFLTGTGYVITPIVGFVATEFEAQPDHNEVASVFEVPLEFLMIDGNLRSTRHERFGTPWEIYEFDYAGHRVWGATAAILRNLIKIIK
ncbi:MAG: CoA pyrophosphatase [Candidatus Rariloculaceae bacterium]